MSVKEKKLIAKASEHIGNATLQHSKIKHSNLGRFKEAYYRMARQGFIVLIEIETEAGS